MEGLELEFEVQDGGGEGGDGCCSIIVCILLPDLFIILHFIPPHFHLLLHHRLESLYQEDSTLIV